MDRGVGIAVRWARWRWVLAITVGLTVLLATGADRVWGASDDSITTPDSGGDVGLYASMVLDDAGNPVVAYYDWTNGDLKILHCNDPFCADGDDKITSPDTEGLVGLDPSLVLDSDGNPVVAYQDGDNDDLKVLHCNDPYCEGGDETITSPDTTGQTGYAPSLALDGDGNPVIAYGDVFNIDLNVMHCNDPFCDGGDETINAPDPSGSDPYDLSMVLDENGNPVVAYYEDGEYILKVVHCQDPDCEDATVSWVDTNGDVGDSPSLALDPDGNPVVAYYDYDNEDLKVLHCADPECLAYNSITWPDTEGDVGMYASLALDADGYPVVAYYDYDNQKLKILHCNDSNCAGGDESITVPDLGVDVGGHPSLVLDGDWNPVVAYYDYDAKDLKVLHCDDPNCADSTPPSLSVPDDIEVEATGPDGAAVVFEATAEDVDDPNPVVECTPESGTTFPVGDTLVECTATDAANNISQDDFTVTVTDSGAPELSLPGDMVAEATSLAGATVDFDVTASDAIDPSPTVMCDPQSGSAFPIGETVVECTATDASGNVGQGAFTVTVSDTVPPALYVVGDLTVEAAGPDGAVVGFGVTAIDAVDPNPSVSCDPESGSTFPVGDSEVECTAVDASGNSAVESFTVTVLAAGGPGSGSGSGDGHEFRFEDVPISHLFDAEIHWLASVDITRGCNPPSNTRYCPEDNVTRGELAAFLTRALNLPSASSDPFIDTAGSRFADDIARLAAAEITRGCNPPDNDRFCADADVTRGQLAAFLVRALRLPPADTVEFVDSAESVFADDIARLAAAGITAGCNPPANDRFCPDDPITRGQVAAFLSRALRPSP